MTQTGIEKRSTGYTSPLTDHATVDCDNGSVLLRNLVSDHKASIPSNDDLSTIRDTTGALEHLTTTHMRLLDARAASFARLGNFKSAIQDAMEMIKLAPRSAFGYLRAGDIMSIRGRQTSALRTYDLALQSVSSSDPQYSDLLKCREEAQRMLDYKIDLISMLPLEILHCILSFLELDTAAVCSTVCKSWQRRFVECGKKLWRSPCIDIRKTRFAALCHTSPSVATQVQSLKITNVCPNRCMVRLSAINSFTNVRSLHLIDVLLYTGLEELIMGILRGVRATLTDLVLVPHLSEPMIPVGSVLTVCNRLVSFKYVNRNTVFKYGDDNPTIVPITSLKLNIPNMSSDDLSKLLRRCPKLRDLSIVSNDLSFVPVIQSLCPNLQKLAAYRRYHEEQTIDTSLSNVSALKGLRALSINVSEQHSDDQHIISLFAESKNSLEFLDIRLPTMNIEYYHVNFGRTLTMPTPYANCNLHFPQLRILHCQFGGLHESVPIAIIRRCPTLEQVDLSYIIPQLRCEQNMPITGIPDALKTLNNLQELSLRRLEDDDLALLAGLFRLHSDLGKKSSLHTVKLYDMRMIDESLLQSFAALENLEALELVCNCISDSGFLDFANQRSAMNLRLKTLKVIPGWLFSDSMIEALKLFKGLQHVTVSTRNRLNEDLMREFIANSKTLQSIHFRDTMCSRAFLTRIKRNGLQVQPVCYKGPIFKVFEPPKPAPWSFLLD